MSISDIFYLNAIKFGSAGSITQLTDTSPSAGLEDITEYSAGHAEPLFTGHSHGSPMISFTTPQIVTLLGLVGADWALDTTGGNTDLEYRKGLQHGYRDATAGVHRLMRATQGLLVLQSIKAAQGQQATASAMYKPTWDGTNDPLQPLGSVSLAATPQAAEQFTLGPVYVNGSLIPGVREWDLNLNPQATGEASEGDEWDSYCDVETLGPVLTVRGRSLAAWATATAKGLAISSLAFYLRRRQPSKINYSNASTQHILFAATNGTLAPVDTSGAGKGKTETSLKIRMHAADSSSASLTATTGSAIS